MVHRWEGTTRLIDSNCIEGEQLSVDGHSLKTIANAVNAQMIEIWGQSRAFIAFRKYFKRPSLIVKGRLEAQECDSEHALASTTIWMRKQIRENEYQELQ